MCAKPKYFFISFSLQSNEMHPGCNTSPPSFQKYSGTRFHIAFFLGIKLASQTCSPSSTLSLSNTFHNNFHIVTLWTILRSKSLELPVNKKNAEDLCEKLFGAFQAGFFSTWAAGFFLSELSIVALSTASALVTWSDRLRLNALWRILILFWDMHWGISENTRLRQQIIAESISSYTDCSHWAEQPEHNK